LRRDAAESPKMKPNAASKKTAPKSPAKTVKWGPLTTRNGADVYLSKGGRYVIESPGRARGVKTEFTGFRLTGDGANKIYPTLRAAKAAAEDFANAVLTVPARAEAEMKAKVDAYCAAVDALPVPPIEDIECCVPGLDVFGGAAATATRPDGSTGLTAAEALQLEGLRVQVRQLNAELDAAYEAGAPGHKIRAIRASLADVEGEAGTLAQIADASPALTMANAAALARGLTKPVRSISAERDISACGGADMLALAREVIAAANAQGLHWELADLQSSLRFRADGRMYWMANLGSMNSEGASAIEALTALRGRFAAFNAKARGA